MLFQKLDESSNVLMNLWCLQCRIFSPIIVVPVVTVTSLGLFLRGFPLVTVSSKLQSAFNNFKRFSLSHFMWSFRGFDYSLQTVWKSDYRCWFCWSSHSKSGIIFFLSFIYDGDCLDIWNLNLFFCCPCCSILKLSFQGCIWYLKDTLCLFVLHSYGLLLLSLLFLALITMFRLPRNKVAAQIVPFLCPQLPGRFITVSSWFLFFFQELDVVFNQSLVFICRISIPYPFQWGTPIFRASHVFGMFGAAIVASAEVQVHRPEIVIYSSVLSIINLVALC